jgi:hypothetical protein
LSEDLRTIIRQGSATTMVVTNNNVGIGTASPLSTLDVSTQMRISGSTVPSKGHLLLARDGLNYVQAGADSGTAAGIAFLTGARTASLANAALLIAADNAATFSANVTASGFVIRSNALPTLASIGANALWMGYHTNKVLYIWTDAATNGTYSLTPP